MKTLFLVRHAKSSRDDPALPDKDRPLNKRGMRDASEWVSNRPNAVRSPTSSSQVPRGVP